MRLLSCLIMVLATLSMTLHLASARPAHEGHAVAAVVHADHDHARAARHDHASTTVHVDRDCPPGHSHRDHGCCDTPCCSAPCVAPVIGEGTYEPAFRFTVRAMPNPDLLPDGTQDGRRIRPPIFG